MGTRVPWVSRLSWWPWVPQAPSSREAQGPDGEMSFVPGRVKVGTTPTQGSGVKADLGKFRGAGRETG